MDILVGISRGNGRGSGLIRLLLPAYLP
eukprot:SAG31_NODE_25899_length_452_cov_0.583569_2_plen_27_part_01